MPAFQVSVAYSQVGLSPADVYPILDPAQPATLAQLTDGGTGLIVTTGISMGPVDLDIVDDPAGIEAPEVGWEEQQVLTMHITEDLFLSSPTMTDSYDTAFTPHVPGPHTATVRARGRALRPDDILMDDDSPVERYLITFEPTA